jgi:hypothetical protein
MTTLVIIIPTTDLTVAVNKYGHGRTYLLVPVSLIQSRKIIRTTTGVQNTSSGASIFQMTVTWTILCQMKQ